MKDDSLKVQTYLKLTLEFIRIDQGSALNYANKAEELADKLGTVSLLGAAKFRKGTVLSSMNMPIEAAKQFLSAQRYYSELGNVAGIASVKVELGRLAQIQSKNEEALAFFLEALPIAQEVGDKNSEARIHNFIGTIYERQKQYRKAIEHYSLALTGVRELNFKPGISACLVNLGNCYIRLEEYGKAVPSLEEAIKIKEEIGDKLGAGRALQSLGVLYNDQKEYEMAEPHYQKAYALAIEVNNPSFLALVEYGLAECSYYKGDYKRSILLANKVLRGNQALKFNELTLKTNRLLSHAYRETGQFQKALEHVVVQIEVSDSLYNEKLVSVTNDLEAKYQNEEKIKEISLLSTEKDLQALQLEKRVNERNALIALAFVILLITGLLYNQFRIKQNANKKLKEVDRLKSSFFANISHEFRTPLTLIKGPIEQLEQNPEEKLSKENIKMIRRNANRVLTLVNQLLDLSKAEGGSLRLEPTEGDVLKCLRAATSSFNSHAAQRHLDYKVQIPRSVLWASFDRDKLEKITYNLLGNSFKFSEDGSAISFQVTYSDSKLKIQVADTGRGIAQEDLPFIFDRFYQVESGSTKEKEGSGIGLSLVKNLVDLMDGTITATSEKGKGSILTVQLPIQEIKIKSEIRIQSSGLPTSPLRYDIFVDLPSVPENYFDKAKLDLRNLPLVLLVEDNGDMREFIKEQLIGLYRVKIGMNGKEGLKMSILESPDLIITDLMMPKMDGMELCKKLKTDVRTSHIPVIMLTAKVGMEHRIEGLETGADDYLTKPFDAKELLVRTKNLIEQRQRLRELFSSKEIDIDPKKVAVTSIDQRFLKKLLEQLEDNYSDPDFGVPQIQEALAMSKTQLHRKLKALTNEAPGELLRNFRLKRAAQLLSQKSDSVTQIAYQVGFNNLSYFAKCFKERYGMAPSSF